MTMGPNHCRAVLEMLALPKFVPGIGLHRMVWAMERLPSREWLANLDAIKVTGSKGKGSTSAVCSAILVKLGIKTGLYTSPHLFRFNERIKISGMDVSDDDLTSAWRATQRDIAGYLNEHPADRFNAFEAFTSAALHVFSQRRVAALVTEAGIGGRYDSTRVIPGKTAALTSVELEHVELLGATPESILYDKADLCPSGGTIVVGRLERELVRRLRGYCKLRDVKLVDVEAESRIGALNFNGSNMEFPLECAGIGFGKITTPLLGEHQAWNIAVGVTAVRDWLSRNRPEISDLAFREAVVEALAEVQWAGRLQRINDSPEVFIDVGHTPQSMRSIASAARMLFGSKPILLVTGVSHDKDVDGILSELAPIAAEIICACAYHKGTPAEQIASACRRIRPGITVTPFEAIEEAAGAALTRASASGMPILVAGGLFLAIEFAAAMRGGDPSQLQFA